MRRIIAAVLLVAFASAPARAQQKPPRQVLDTDVDRAIEEAKRYLWGQQLPTGFFRYYWNNVPRGGGTALALLALMEVGESHQQKNMIKSLDALAGLKTTNTYVVATRTMVFSRVIGKGSKNELYKTCLANDLKFLTNQAGRWGAWDYDSADRDGDNSVSQFALLALWEATRGKQRIPEVILRSVERTWLKRQRRDGGWTYAALPETSTPSTMTMTSAGIASLYICQDMLIRDCRPYYNQKHADRAWDLLAGQLKADLAKHDARKRIYPEYWTRGYLFFCVQRIGMTTGRKFIGDMDWFAIAAEKLCEPNPRGRSYYGKWGTVVRASFELLFLSRGRIPLTFNKLAYGEEKDRNFHTRDIAHFTEYMRREFETPMRWQIVKVADEIERMLDAPILVVAGQTDPKFTDEQWNKLREYSLRGGTLLFIPSHGGTEFLEAVKKRLGGLYGKDREMAGAHFTLEKLGEEHPFYTCYLNLKTVARNAPIWGVSDGTRLLAVVNQRDLACPWHRRDERRGGKTDFELGVNFYMTTTGRNQLSTRLRPVFHQTGGEVRHRARIARIRHSGNWATQPYALDPVNRKLIAENRVAIDFTDGALIDAKSLAGKDLVWMTGAAKFELTDRQIRILRDYLDRGGTLFVNAVGGSEDFNDAADSMIEKIFEGRDVGSGMVPINHALITGKAGDFRGPKLGKLEQTWSLQQSPARTGPVLIGHAIGDRIMVIQARKGIHDTLDGHMTYGAKSLMPNSARDVAANIVLYALSLRGTVRPPPEPEPEPTTQPVAAPIAAP